MHQLLIFVTFLFLYHQVMSDLNIFSFTGKSSNINKSSNISRLEASFFVKQTNYTNNLISSYLPVCQLRKFLLVTHDFYFTSTFKEFFVIFVIFVYFLVERCVLLPDDPQLCFTKGVCKEKYQKLKYYLHRRIILYFRSKAHPSFCDL